LLGASKLKIKPIGIGTKELLAVMVAVVEPVRAIIESLVKPTLKVLSESEAPMLGVTTEAISSEEFGEHKVHSKQHNPHNGECSKKLHKTFVINAYFGIRIYIQT
jgi:hypothetical protein